MNDIKIYACSNEETNHLDAPSLVMPRDLFLQAMLLKCLGFVCLHIVDGRAGKLKFKHKEIRSFKVVQDLGSGDYFCDNIEFYLEDTLEKITFHIPPSKSSNSLIATNEKEHTFYVLDDKGEFTEDFKIAVGVK